MSGDKVYTIFAGVNGAGKSTFYKALGDNGRLGIRINTDEIVQDMFGHEWQNQQAQIVAGRIAIEMIKECIGEGKSFNQETTLTGRSIVNNIKKAKEKGFQIHLHYVGLESVKLSLRRVEARRLEGGHGIPVEDIIKRYPASLANLKEVLPMCDSVKIYDNSKEMAFQIEKPFFNAINGEIIHYSKEIPLYLKEIIQDCFQGTNLETGGKSMHEEMARPSINADATNKLESNEDPKENLRNKPYSAYKECTTWGEIEEYREAKGYKEGWSYIVAEELGIENPEQKANRLEEQAWNFLDYADYERSQNIVGHSYVLLADNGNNGYDIIGDQAVQVADALGMSGKIQEMQMGDSVTLPKLTVDITDEMVAIAALSRQGLNVAIEESNLNFYFYPAVEQPKQELPVPPPFIITETDKGAILYLMDEQDPAKAVYAVEYSMEELKELVDDVKKHVESRQSINPNGSKFSTDRADAWNADTEGTATGTIIATEEGLYHSSISEAVKEKMGITLADFDKFDELTKGIMTPEKASELMGITDRIKRIGASEWDKFYEVKSVLKELEEAKKVHPVIPEPQRPMISKGGLQEGRDDKHQQGEIKAKSVAKNELKEMKESLKKPGTTFADIENVRKVAGHKPGWSFHTAKRLGVEIEQQKAHEVKPETKTQQEYKKKNRSEPSL